MSAISVAMSDGQIVETRRYPTMVSGLVIVETPGLAGLSVVVHGRSGLGLAYSGSPEKAMQLACEVLGGYAVDWTRSGHALLDDPVAVEARKAVRRAEDRAGPYAYAVRDVADLNEVGR